MEYANKISPLFLWISFISAQLLENSTTEFQTIKPTLSQEEKNDLNTTEKSATTFHSFQATEELKTVTEAASILNSTLVSENSSIPADVVENPSPLKKFSFGSEHSNSSMLNESSRSFNVVEESSPFKELNDSVKLLSSTKENFTNANETSERNQKPIQSQHTRDDNSITPPQPNQEVQSSENKTSEELKTSETYQIRTILPLLHNLNSRVGVWKVPFEVLELEDDGSGILKPATMVESNSFITNPEISTVRMNLALPETRSIARMERRYPSEGDGRPAESYSSEESDGPGVHTETSEDYGRFLEDDYRKEIEKEAEAFVKRQKALNATKGNKPDSAEDENPEPNEKKYSGLIEKQYPGSMENKYSGSTENQYPGSEENPHPGSMENQYPASIEKEYDGSIQKGYPGSAEKEYPGSTEKEYPGSTEKEYPVSTENEYPGSIENKYPATIENGNEPSKTDSERGYFTNQNGNRQIETSSHQGYFTNQNGNKVFFYKGKQDSFNIEDVFPIIKFTRTHNQPLFFPENFYWPDVMNDPPKSFSPFDSPEPLPPYLNTNGPPLTEQKNFHTNKEVPELHLKQPPTVEDSPCPHDPEEYEQPPQSYQEPVNQEYDHHSEPEQPPQSYQEHVNQEYIPHSEPEQNYDADPQDSSETECDENPSNYQGNRNYELPQPFEPHIINSQPEFEGRGNLGTGPPMNLNNEAHYPPHDSNVIHGGPDTDEMKKSKVHQIYQTQQKYQEELQEKKSSFTKHPSNIPYHFHRESDRQNSPEQIRTIENYDHSPPNQEDIFSPPFRHSPNPKVTQNSEFSPPNSQNWMPIIPHTNIHSFQHQNQNPKLPGNQIIVTGGRNNVVFPQKNQEYIPPSRHHFIPTQVQNPSFIPFHVTNRNFIPLQNHNPDARLRINLHLIRTNARNTPDFAGIRNTANYHPSAPSYHQQKQLETPRSMELAITRSANLAFEGGAVKLNKDGHISISSGLMPLASSEHQTKEIVPKKESKKTKRKSSKKRSKSRKRNGRNSTTHRARRQRKTRRSTRDKMKAEAATYHWGMEDHKDKDGFFMYANNPHEEDYEYGYRVGGPQQTLERHHRTTGSQSTIKLNWEDQNGDSGDQYWEFNHTDSEDEASSKVPAKPTS